MFTNEMKQGFVIAHHKSNREFLDDLLQSFGECPYPIYIVLNDVANTSQEYIDVLYDKLDGKASLILNEDDGYELGALTKAYEDTDLDEIFLLQDTLIIKDILNFCHNAFVVAKGRPCYMQRDYKMYLCKYRREVLGQMYPFPKTPTKQDAVAQEGAFNRTYFDLEWTKGILGQSLDDTNIFEEKYGKNRMVLENEYIIKWKATWRPELIATAD